jgi:hypothetical protein
MSGTGTRRLRRRTRGLLTFMVALALAGAATATAVAMSPYTVHVKVPSTVKLSSSFSAMVYGESANTSALKVFHDTQSCAATPTREQAHPHATTIINKDVTNAYSVTWTGKATVLGKHYICAYLLALPPAALLRGHAFASYTTVS